MRRPLDFYPTPEFATQELLKRVQLYGTVFECCAGDNAITHPLKTYGLTVHTGDIDLTKTPDVFFDASLPWPGFLNPDWVVTNPPFNLAFEILEQARLHAVGGVAFLLRLSFLEPTHKRRRYLELNPPDKLIVLPRISFTGDGKTDSVTCAWMVWAPVPKGIEIVNGETQKL